jgi:hypothetical protein
MTDRGPASTTARTLPTVIHRFRTSLVGAIAAAAGIAAVATVLTTSPAFACSCASATPAAKPAADAVVFTGTVSRYDVGGYKTTGDPPVPFDVVHFMVDTVYQGSVTADQTVLNFDGLCQYGFMIGQRYTIITEPLPDDGHLSVSLCGGASPGGIDPAVYGLSSGVPPRATAAVQGRSWAWPVLTASLLGAIALVTAITLIGRSRAAGR